CASGERQEGEKWEPVFGSHFIPFASAPVQTARWAEASLQQVVAALDDSPGRESRELLLHLLHRDVERLSRQGPFPELVDLGQPPAEKPFGPLWPEGAPGWFEDGLRLLQEQGAAV